MPAHGALATVSGCHLFYEGHRRYSFVKRTAQLFEDGLGQQFAAGLPVHEAFEDGEDYTVPHQITIRPLGYCQSISRRR